MKTCEKCGKVTAGIGFNFRRTHCKECRERAKQALADLRDGALDELGEQVDALETDMTRSVTSATLGATASWDGGSSSCSSDSSSSSSSCDSSSSSSSSSGCD